MVFVSSIFNKRQSDKFWPQGDSKILHWSKVANFAIYFFTMSDMASTIFITGGSTGIGRAAVERFVAEDWNVAFLDIDTEKAAELLQNLGCDDRVLFVEGDTRSRDDIKKAVEATEARFGGIDALFANAGIHRNNQILTITDEELHRIVDINLFGTVHTLQAVVPAIIRRGGGSVVINCSDQWFIGKPNSFAYGMTKGALGQITRSLSIDLAKHNIRVNAICPGSIDTPLLEGALRRSSEANNVSYDELYQAENDLYDRGRMGKPEEVANLVYFLASGQSTFITGAHYAIDGGLIAR